MSATVNKERHRFLSKALMNSGSKGTAVITGASSGIGAVYADQLASRGYDLILVARNRDRLSAVAKRISEDTGRSVEIIVADLGNRADLSSVVRRIGGVVHAAVRQRCLVCTDAVAANAVG